MRTAWILALALASGQLSAQETAGDPPAAPAEPAVAEETRLPLLVNRALAAYQAKDYAAMEENLKRVAELRPYLAQFRFLLAKAYALQDKKREAYDTLVRLQEQGLSLPLEGDEDFANIKGFQLYDYLVERFAKNAEPYGQASRVLTIDETDLLIESIAWDPTREQFLAGSVINGTIYQVAESGELTAFIQPDETNGLLGVVDLEVDADAGVLWALSGASPQVKHARLPDAGKTYVHKFDLKTGKALARFHPPVPSSYLLDLALAPSGAVFVTDSAQPVVWQLPAEKASTNKNAPLDMFLAAGNLSGLRAITVDGAGKNLYFSDYEQGLFGVEIATKQPFRVHLGDRLNLSGIDAMDWYDDSLVLVQNGIVPRRVLRFQLFDDGRRGRHSQAMLSGQPEFRNPVATTMVGNQLHLIANSHRNAYDPRTGQLREGAEVKPHQVLKLSLDYGWLPPPMPQASEAEASAGE